MVERILIEESGRAASVILVGRANRADPEHLVGDHRYARVAVFTQEPARGVAGEVAAALRDTGAEVGVETLPDREEAKALGVAETCYRWLNDQGLTRGDLIVGVGGGALTDVAGFVAATYLRGLPVVFVPTTLLGAVDAAIGGKTAVNVDGKNLAGVFKHPERVIIDVAVLEALPAGLLREGHAEALKAGLVGDAELVRLYERHGAQVSLEEVVRRAVAVKAAVVSEDFREAGRRAILNYGHTIGHAVEALSGISHGEAVAVGMVAAGAASARVLGFDGEVVQGELIRSLGLPTTAPRLDRNSVEAMMRLDKKRDDTGLRMVLLEEVARPVLRPVGPATVEAALSAIGIA